MYAHHSERSSHLTKTSTSRPPARVLLDVRDSASVERAVTGVEQLDILVNVAGVGGWGATETYSDALNPAEIIGPALFLASRAASMVTGHILAVDGGYVVR